MGKPMVKSEFIREFCDLFPQSDETLSTDVADAILDHIVNKLVDGGRIEIRGFGSLGVKYREPHKGRNPQDGSRVDVAGRYVAFFRAGKNLRERVDADPDGLGWQAPQPEL